MATQTTQTHITNQPRRTNKPRNRNQKKTGGTGTGNGNGNGNTTPDTAVPEEQPKEANTKQTGKAIAVAEEEDESDVCWICAESIKYFSLSECNRRTCHICALRLRALYKKKECTFCNLKHPQEAVIFTSSPDTLYEQYNQDEMHLKDTKLSIVFSTQEMMEETLILLRFNCPDEDCPFIAKGWNDLKMHVRAMHGKQLCDICIRSKKVFSHEHTLYTQAQLQVHMPSLPQRGKGVSTVKEIPEGGVHPLCEFCRECFFSGDELFAHMREKHEDCFICKRMEIRDQYFQDYNTLERHFNDKHYACTQAACQAQKFVVFGSLMDLKAHMVEEHGANMSAKDMKDARRVETNFAFEEPRGAGSRRRERDRDRDAGRDPPPHTAALQQRPLDRRRDGFGAALTDENGSGSNASLNQRNGRSSPSPPSDVDPETARRHAAFMARVANVTSSSSSAATTVRLAIRSFRASESAARDIISIFYNMVERDLEATASLIIPLVDLLDDEDKKKELLEAFNGFKIEQRQQFPDLVSSGQDSAYAGVASGRVLNAKHSTQSRRSAGQVWDRVARAASSSVPGAAGLSSRPADRFPTLPRVTPAVAANSANKAPAFRQPQRSTPWASSSSAAFTQPPPISQRIFSETKTNKITSSPAANFTKSAFPSLPTAAPRVKPPVGGNKSLRNIIGNPGPVTNAWNGSSEDANDIPATDEATEENTTEVSLQQRKGKKKGKEKVTLFTLGAYPA